MSAVERRAGCSPSPTLVRSDHARHESASKHSLLAPHATWARPFPPRRSQRGTWARGNDQPDADVEFAGTAL